MTLADRLVGALSNEADVLVFPDADDAANRVLARHQDERTDWHYGPVNLGAYAQQLRTWSQSLLATFLPVGLRTPEFLFRFERESVRVLGHYVQGRNDVGLQWESSINPRHLGRPAGVIAAVLLHELVHWWEEATRKPSRARNGYHSAWFRAQAEAFGIPCTRFGAALGIVIPSRFSQWAAAHNLAIETTEKEEPDDTIRDPRPVPEKRVPWVCACPPGELVTVQVPRASELRAHCDRCGAAFQRKGELR